MRHVDMGIVFACILVQTGEIPKKTFPTCNGLVIVVSRNRIEPFMFVVIFIFSFFTYCIDDLRYSLMMIFFRIPKLIDGKQLSIFAYRGTQFEDAGRISRRDVQETGGKVDGK